MRTSQRPSDFIPWEVVELCLRVKVLPRQWRGELIPLCRALAGWTRRQSRLVQAAQEAVDQLQLDIKCLRFDLDATRRERDALRQRCEHD